MCLPSACPDGRPTRVRPHVEDYTTAFYNGQQEISLCAKCSVTLTKGEGCAILCAVMFQPAVLRLVRHVISAAHAQGKWVGLCGELAGEPLALPILLGLGLDEFSMNPPAIPPAKRIVRALALDEAREVAQAALELDNPDAVQALVRERVPRRPMWDNRQHISPMKLTLCWGGS